MTICVIYHIMIYEFCDNKNSLCAKFFKRNPNLYLHFFFISAHCEDTNNWNLSSWKTMACLFQIASIVTADDLATQGARASAAIILTLTSFDKSVAAR